MTELPTGTVTFLFSEIEGSTRLPDVNDATHFLHLDRPNRGRDRLLRDVLRLLAG